MFCAIKVYEGETLRVKQILNTSKTNLIDLILFLSCAPANYFMAKMGMHSLVGSIQSLPGKGFSGP